MYLLILQIDVLLKQWESTSSRLSNRANLRNGLYDSMYSIQSENDYNICLYCEQLCNLGSKCIELFYSTWFFYNVYPFLILFISTFFFLSYILYGSHFVWCKMSHDFTIHDSQMMSWDIKSLELNLYSTIFPPISLRLIICKNKKFCILHSLFYSTTNICINHSELL